MVVGLVHGMAANLDETVEVVHARRREKGADHDLFEIRRVVADAA